MGDVVTCWHFGQALCPAPSLSQELQGGMWRSLMYVMCWKGFGGETARSLGTSPEAA